MSSVIDSSDMYKPSIYYNSIKIYIYMNKILSCIFIIFYSYVNSLILSDLSTGCVFLFIDEQYLEI